MAPNAMTAEGVRYPHGEANAAGGGLKTPVRTDTSICDSAPPIITPTSSPPTARTEASASTSPRNCRWLAPRAEAIAKERLRSDNPSAEHKPAGGRREEQGKGEFHPGEPGEVDRGQA